MCTPLLHPVSTKPYRAMRVSVEAELDRLVAEGSVRVLRLGSPNSGRNEERPKECQDLWRL